MSGNLLCIRVVCVLFVTLTASKADEEKSQNSILAEESHLRSNEVGDKITNEEFYENNEIENEYRETIFFEHDSTSPKPIDIVVTTTYGVITTVGLAANGLVFFVIFGGKEIDRTITAIYITQLALADSLFLLSLPVFSVQKITNDWKFGEITCAICQAVKFLNYYAGIFFLTLMSIDRYIAVAHAFKAHQLRTKKRALLACAIVWLFSCFLAAPVGIYSKTEKIEEAEFCKVLFPGYEELENVYESIDLEMLMPEPNNFSTEYDEMSGYYENHEREDYNNYAVNVREANESDFMKSSLHEDESKPNASYDFVCSNNIRSPFYNTWITLNFVIGFLFPFITISVCYGFILKQIRLSEKKFSNTKKQKNYTTRKKVTRMVAVLVSCFVCCWLPYQAFLMLKIKGINLSFQSCFALEEFLVALGFSNSAFNPILYTFFGQNFKRRLSESIRRVRVALECKRKFNFVRAPSRNQYSGVGSSSTRQTSRTSFKFENGRCIINSAKSKSLNKMQLPLLGVENNAKISFVLNATRQTGIELSKTSPISNDSRTFDSMKQLNNHIHTYA